MTTEDKIKELNKIDKQIIKLLMQCAAECKKPAPKRTSTALKRCGMVIRITIQIRGLEMQKRLLASQPTPKFKPGAYQTGTVGEMNHELPETISKR